jgi:hypothetical protein
MVPAGTTKALGASGFMLVIAVFDMAEPEPPPDEEFAVFPPLLLSLDDGDELESGGAAGLLQPSKANDK